MTHFYTQPDGALILRKTKEYRDLYIEKYFPKDTSTRILDLGCSYGLFLVACKDAGYLNYEGVDFEREAVEYALHHFGLKNIFQADIFAYLHGRPLRDYDIITAFNIVEHIKKERVEELFELIATRLKPGGEVYLEVPNADSPIGIHTFYSDLTHEFAYTKGLMIRLLRMHGFDDVRVMPNRVRSNVFIRLAQKVLAKIVGFDDKLMFSGNIIVIAKKK